MPKSEGGGGALLPPPPPPSPTPLKVAPLWRSISEHLGPTKVFFIEKVSFIRGRLITGRSTVRTLAIKYLTSINTKFKTFGMNL